MRRSTTALSPSLLRGFVLLIGAVLLASCAAPKHGLAEGGEISKVKSYRFRPFEPLPPGTDPMIAHEAQYHRHGAYNAEQLNERKGNYYTVYWAVDDRTQPAVVRFDFMQEKDAGEVQTTEVTVDSPGRRNTTDFEVVGQDFASSGDVRAWKATVLQDGREVATYQSFLWK